MSAIANKTESWAGHSFQEVETFIKSNLSDETFDEFYITTAPTLHFPTAKKYVLCDKYSNILVYPNYTEDATGGKIYVCFGKKTNEVGQILWAKFSPITFTAEELVAAFEDCYLAVMTTYVYDNPTGKLLLDLYGKIKVFQGSINIVGYVE